MPLARTIEEREGQTDMGSLVFRHIDFRAAAGKNFMTNPEHRPTNNQHQPNKAKDWWKPPTCINLSGHCSPIQNPAQATISCPCVP